MHFFPPSLRLANLFPAALLPALDVAPRRRRVSMAQLHAPASTEAHLPEPKTFASLPPALAGWRTCRVILDAHAGCMSTCKIASAWRIH
jgi:hypothetical protein